MSCRPCRLSHPRRVPYHCVGSGLPLCSVFKELQYYKKDLITQEKKLQEMQSKPDADEYRVKHFVRSQEGEW